MSFKGDRIWKAIGQRTEDMFIDFAARAKGTKAQVCYDFAHGNFGLNKDYGYQSVEEVFTKIAGQNMDHFYIPLSGDNQFLEEFEKEYLMKSDFNGVSVQTLGSTECYSILYHFLQATYKTPGNNIYFPQRSSFHNKSYAATLGFNVQHFGNFD